MDIRMPVVDGIEATRRITAEDPSLGVVVLTMSGDDGTVFSAVRAGARGYLSPKTVRSTVSDIFSTLQVADRAQAIVAARDAGLGRG